MNDQGFSLLELIVVMTVSTVLMLVATDFFMGGLRDSNNEYEKTTVLVNTKAAVETVARSIELSRAVEASNAQPDNNAPGGSGAPYSWSGTAGNGATLILALPSHDTSGNLIYTDGLHMTPYTDDVIYYLDSSSHRLYRRTIANQTAPQNRAITTCPPAIATAGCPPDKIVVEDVANLTTQYLDANNASVTQPSGTEAVSYTVTQTRLVGTHTYQGQYSTIASLRNK